MKATAGANALLPGIHQRPLKRRSDRHKKQDRRAKARRVQSSLDENAEYREAVWVDALEGVDPSAPAEDEDEYDELAELDGNKRKRRKTAPSKSQGSMPKRFLLRTAAAILVDEASRVDGVAKAFIRAEALTPTRQHLPRKKFCPVTGLEGTYTEPKSSIPFASFKALEQIRERPPPWMTLSGSAAYSEAVKSIRDDGTS